MSGYRGCRFTKKIDPEGVALIEVSDYKRCRNTRANTVVKTPKSICVSSREGLERLKNAQNSLIGG